MDKADPMRIKDLKDKEEPNDANPKMLSPEPSRWNDLVDKEDPNSTKSITEIRFAIVLLTSDLTLKALPNRAKLRHDKADPTLAKSRIDTCEPNLAKLRTEKVDPRLE
jgi:hypothetical protein